MRPLSDIKVLQIGGIVDIAYAGRLLADLGADVLVVEPVGGSRLRQLGPFSHEYGTPNLATLHLQLNRGKRAVTLNTAESTGRDILRRLVERHDVVLHDLDNETAAAVGLDPATAAGTSTIGISVTPFGRSGPKASWKGYEINVQATSGVILGLGGPGRAPLPIPDFVTEFFVGSVISLATLLAVTARDKFGTADSVDLASTDAWATFQTGLALVNWLFGGQSVQRGGQARRGGPYPNTILKCKDGDYRLIAMTKREWVRFVHLMGDPDWAKEERFQDRIKMNELYSEELDQLVMQWLRQRTKQELFELCYEGGVPFTPINNFSDVLADRQMRARGVWEPLVVGTLPPLVGPRSPHGIASRKSAGVAQAPAIGENNYEVYVDELAVVPGESYQELYQAGVI